ncbi:putative ribonuclease H-like domain-containing protein [Rosa chinensis]|uniref:Putative ribonuclease H-like domain-containing protein n=1 Tax=Rosa chinensis TaxID=74649 RepID=A0A2P6QYC9_ROSCH|nr:putative ribonuclease H-like domain-containing protein [Rosa chinensis]
MIVHAAAAAAYNYRAHNSVPTMSRARDYGLIRWAPPQEGSVKLNFDGSVDGSNMAAARFVIRDHSGFPIVAGSRKIGFSSVPVAECSALKDGLLQALHSNLSKISVEGDSKLVIDCIKKIHAPPWRLRPLIRDIQIISSFFEDISFSHVPREANFVADPVTSLGHQAFEPTIWRNKLPLSASSAFSLDQLGCGVSRGFQL